MYNDALVYGTEMSTETRYWRYRDIFAVLALDRERLQILVHEGGAGELRPFTFQLKSDAPEGFAQALWTRVNPPTRPSVPAHAAEVTAVQRER